MKGNWACATCRYAEKSREAGVLACHRYPPIARQFPMVLAGEWCGEYLGGEGAVSHAERDRR